MHQELLTACLLLLVIAAVPTESYRFLAYFPVFAGSHHFFFRPVLEALAARGHEVVYLTGYPYTGPVPANITQIKYFEEHPARDDDFDPLEFGQLSLPKTLEFMYYIMTESAVDLNSEVMQNLIHATDEKFDAVIFESVFFAEHSSAFLHKFDAVGIELVSFGCSSWVNDLAGMPSNPSFQTDCTSDLSDNMNFLERLYNTYVIACGTLLRYYYYMPGQEALAAKYFNYTGWESRPHIRQLMSNRSLILVNQDPVIGGPEPLPPHIKHIAGAHIAPVNPLPEDVQKFMDESDAGVVFMSLGTNVNVSRFVTGGLLESFFTVFRELPRHRILMKWEKEYDGTLPSNLKMSKYFPQKDIFAHKKCVLFITHGGFLSTAEATKFGVPMVGIPFFYDQVRNLMQVQENGYGRILRYKNITTENLRWTVREVLFNERYQTEATRRSERLRARRQTPLEDAVYWIEYAVKYPNALTPRSAFQSYPVRHLLDVKLFVIAVLLVSLFLLCRLFKALCCLFKCKKPATKLKKS